MPPTRKDSTTASRNAHHHVALVLSICATEAARLAIISTHMPTTMPKICPQLSHERNAIRPKLSKLFHVPIVQRRATPAKVAPRLPTKHPDCVATCCRGHPYQFLSKARTIPCNYGPHICRESNNEPTEKTNSMKETGRNIATRGCPPIPGMHSSMGTSLIPHAAVERATSQGHQHEPRYYYPGYLRPAPMPKEQPQSNRRNNSMCRERTRPISCGT